MRALQLGLLVSLAIGGTGCTNAACIEYGDGPLADRCVDDTISWLCELSSASEEDGGSGCSSDPPIRCDDYRLGTGCADEGFSVDCDGIWYRDHGECS